MTAHVQPSTYESRVISRAKAARAACYGKPKVVNLIGQMRHAIEAMEEKPDDPEGFLLPKDFMKFRCAFHGVSYAEITVEGRMSKRILKIRKMIVEETRDRFPGLSLMKLARLINRNHSTCLYILDRLPHKKGVMLAVADRDRKAKALYLAGVTIQNIAIELGISESTVKAIKRRNKWNARPKPKAPRLEKVHEKEARRLYDLGMTQKQIGERLGMHQSCIYAMKKRWKWPERKGAGE
ncbi:transposase [Neorhizobium sp. 2083]|uniref:terminase gpP N-terminus-related DNA-binding protein n=1 Tax=Neorhizobium sp. 2083 TaxID=2817762 RepID=UPI00285A3D8D|nr:hypothetical protein [Neorhizobium sp. 2083]MDR6818485.1 transposase [Neorhizobium sp. 2083]